MGKAPRARRTARRPAAAISVASATSASDSETQRSILPTIAAIPLTLIVFAATTVVVGGAWILWDETYDAIGVFVSATIAGCMGVVGGRQAADLFVPGYSKRAVFLGFVLAIVTALAFDPIGELRDHWIATGLFALLMLALAFATFWRDIDLT